MNLEAPGNVVSAPTIKFFQFRHCFALFISVFFFFFLLRTFCCVQNSKTAVARNLKFGDMMSLYMKCTPAFLEAWGYLVWGKRAQNL